MDYWKECVFEALLDVGLDATDTQIEIIARAVEGAHENYGMAFGYDAIPNPLLIENDRLKREIKIERDKVLCTECKGIGRIITYGPYHSSDSECWKCKGEGRHSL